MRINSITNSITSVIVRFDAFVGSVGNDVRTILNLTFMRERLEYWQHMCEPFHPCQQNLGILSSISWYTARQPGSSTKLPWLKRTALHAAALPIPVAASYSGMDSLSGTARAAGLDRVRSEACRPTRHR